ncbi:MAG TPA: D-alanyl-D-alanine carboxypeptidase family protein [Rubrobacteraceae bacterium]|nr:D-alanyl-D-alanine carboxypeptidase family protein [Rubrobacteraceae bacterium]
MLRTSYYTAILLALVLTLQGVAAPGALAEPGVGARSWVLTDAESGEYLAGENASERLSMGSTDKIMVALVALRQIETGEVGLEDEVTVSEDAAAFATPLYSNVGLFAGDTLSVRELLAAALVPSGNDAAYALAEHLGDGDVGAFVERMNREAELLGLGDTRFQNPTGLDARGQYSSARDLAAMARAASEYPLFRELVSTEYTTITTQDREIELVSTNELLYIYPPATGVKTGTTPGAGPSLVASAAAEDETYVSVVLDDVDRFASSVRLLDYGFTVYDRTDLVVRGEQYARAEVPYRRGEMVGLVAKRNVEGLVGKDPEVRRETRVFEDLPGSAKKGMTLGEVLVEVDGKQVGEAPLVASRGYDAATLWERVWYTASRPFKEP